MYANQYLFVNWFLYSFFTRSFCVSVDTCYFKVLYRNSSLLWLRCCGCITTNYLGNYVPDLTKYNSTKSLSQICKELFTSVASPVFATL